MPKSLPTVRPEHEGLGLSTIMNAGLAARHGVAYVHLVVFAVDLDRIREQLENEREEGVEDLWPFGWEVFLIEMHLLGSVDVTRPEQLEMLEDTLSSILEHADEEPPLGASLAFATYDAVRRGELPEELGKPFGRWKKKPSPLVRALDELFERPEVEAAELAEACLAVELSPPLAPPTRDALGAMVATYETDRDTTPAEDEEPS